MKNQVVINEHIHDIETHSGETYLNGKPADFKLTMISQNRYLLVRSDKSYEVEILNSNDGNYELNINGQNISLEILDHQKQILKEMGFSTIQDDHVGEIRSPMPGAIIEISCKEGQEVVKGEPLLILEAMKMENIIKAPASGIITSIKVSQGDSVEKNQTLLVF